MKGRGQIKSFRRAQLFVISLFLLSFSPSVQALDTRWPFELHPLPYAWHLNAKEFAVYIAAGKPDPYAQYCKRFIEANYQIYQMRYPSYTLSQPIDTHLMDWKIYLVTPSSHIVSLCIVSDALFSLGELAEQRPPGQPPVFSFSGMQDIQPENTGDLAISEIISEMLAYANTGMADAIDTLLIASRNFPEIISFSPEIEYYFVSMALNQLAIEAKEYGTFPLDREEAFERLYGLAGTNPVLPDARKILIEQAAQNFDFQTVLDMRTP